MMFDSILTGVTGGLDIGQALLCALVSLALGLFIAVVYMQLGSYTKNFVMTLVLLPVTVQVVIMMVNGNVGTGVAVAGAFSLVRFRSAPGTSREIVAIFIAMAVGLATGMGYLTLAALFSLLVGLALLLLGKTHFGEHRWEQKDLSITIPENLDYTEIFDDILAEYTKESALVKVKTTNLGSMYQLCYIVVLRDSRREKQMIDAIRCRNGNLTVSCGRLASEQQEL